VVQSRLQVDRGSGGESVRILEILAVSSSPRALVDSARLNRVGVGHLVLRHGQVLDVKVAVVSSRTVVLGLVDAPDETLAVDSLQV